MSDSSDSSSDKNSTPHSPPPEGLAEFQDIPSDIFAEPDKKGAVESAPAVESKISLTPNVEVSEPVVETEKEKESPLIPLDIIETAKSPGVPEPTEAESAPAAEVTAPAVEVTPEAPTVEAAPEEEATVAPAKKKSNIYIILGAVLALVVLGAFALTRYTAKQKIVPDPESIVLGTKTNNTNSPAVNNAITNTSSLANMDDLLGEPTVATNAPANQNVVIPAKSITASERPIDLSGDNTPKQNTLTDINQPIPEPTAPDVISIKPPSAPLVSDLGEEAPVPAPIGKPLDGRIPSTSLDGSEPSQAEPSQADPLTALDGGIKPPSYNSSSQMAPADKEILAKEFTIVLPEGSTYRASPVNTPQLDQLGVISEGESNILVGTIPSANNPASAAVLGVLDNVGKSSRAKGEPVTIIPPENFNSGAVSAWFFTIQNISGNRSSVTYFIVEGKENHLLLVTKSAEGAAGSGMGSLISLVSSIKH